MPDKKLSDGTVVRTNLIPRERLFWCELTKAEQEQLDYAKGDQEKEDDFSGFRFKGEIWDIGEFVRTEEDGALKKAGWHGVSGQSAFHGVVIHLCDNHGQVVVGQVFS